MPTYTSTLPDELFHDLKENAARLRKPINAIIENALRIYLTELRRAAYAKSWKLSSDDPDVINIAEEGMKDYLQQLNDLDEAM